MVSKKKRRQPRDENGGSDRGKENDGVGGVAQYEQSREQRIQENLERMKKLGILELSRNLKPPPKPKSGRPLKKPLPPRPPPGSPRRSSRLKTMPVVNYSEKHVPIAVEKVLEEVKIEIEAGSKPEVYTEEHERMLGDHKETWTLYVDGYDDEGQRIYDPYGGKSCHQCRQKTLGHRTKCSKCKSFQGQFCGDCLFMRYGENVLEANANPDWVCPSCRDICNCSRCRRVKGWKPTGNIYRKALKLGFKSVAHYLIHTRGPHGKHDDIASENSSSAEKSTSPTDDEAEVSDGKLSSQLDGENNDETEEDGKRNVLIEKDIKHHDHDQQSKRDDGDVDLDNGSAPVDEMEEDSKRNVSTEKEIEHYDHDQQSDKDDNDVDLDCSSDPDDEDDSDYEEDSCED